MPDPMRMAERAEAVELVRDVASYERSRGFHAAADRLDAFADALEAETVFDVDRMVASAQRWLRMQWRRGS